ncbi:hypothetical protein [Clavibacter tessellarius]|uniref:hypothetical protein n=1 Tax=Clavibacter tessellarius TaxID=31965 RepID=UPI001F46C467|nr:hypothetical protein [Clavibacter michiganensis]
MVRLALDLAESRIADWSATRVLWSARAPTPARASRRSVTAASSTCTSTPPRARAQKFAGPTASPRWEGRDLLRALAASDIVVTLQHGRRSPCSPPITCRPPPPSSGDGRRRLVIDLGLPRNVDPDVVTVDGVELLDL